MVSLVPGERGERVKFTSLNRISYYKWSARKYCYKMHMFSNRRWTWINFSRFSTSISLEIYQKPNFRWTCLSYNWQSKQIGNLYSTFCSVINSRDLHIYIKGYVFLIWQAFHISGFIKYNIRSLLFGEEGGRVLHLLER